MHAWVLARSQRAQALDYLLRALSADVTDIQGGTTPEGIHLAAMAGSVDLLQRCFAGVETRGDAFAQSVLADATLACSSSTSATAATGCGYGFRRRTSESAQHAATTVLFGSIAGVAK